ncbi:uncharacterized protein LOC135350527 [Halichondria panicea]|uniref:uncharacterized protein LOC135350527 n=1 Tax=Halichondria panicea TaxID=6063 RepID=UPI00312BC35B
MLIKLCLLSHLLLTAFAAKTPLHLLALVPLGQGSAQDCVDRGRELLTAAHLAAEIANNNILTEYQLEIVPVETSRCSNDSFSLTLANFVAGLTSRSRTVVGVVGMMCSSAVLSVSPLASHDGIDILQITSGTVSPLSIANAREKVQIDRLYQTASPSTVFNDKLIRLINQNNVTRLAVIRHIGTFFIEHDIISTDLHTKLGNRVNITDFEIQFDTTQVPRILDSIVSNSDGIRMIYASVTIEEARELLCNSLSSERGAEVVYPRNQWIFHSHTYEDLVEPISTCNETEMRRALVGVILLQHSDRDESNSAIILSHTNYTYSSYLERYRQELNNDNNSLCDKNPGIIHANALYDSVLAFALAINNSMLNQAQLSGYSFRNSTRESKTFVTETLKKELDKLPPFHGASGLVSFNSETHGVSRTTSVRVVVVVDNNTELPLMLGTFSSKDNKIHYALPIATMALVLILVLVHTTTLLLFGYYWSDPDIKATSPGLGLIMFAACYMLDISLLLTALRYSYATNEQFVVFCVLENWLLFIGIQLIFATLLMRLLRVQRIFFHYSKLGKVWSDYSMLLAILVFVSIAVIILTFWMAIDTPTLGIQTTFVSATQTPFFSVVLSCKSRYFDFFPIWIVLLLGYTGIIMAMVLLLAIRTRKIQLESFKDTKTVNVFVYTTVVCFMFLMVVSLIFEGVGDQVVTFVFRVLALSSVAIACTCFLFLPKIYSAQCLRRNPRRKSVTTQNSASFVASNAYMTTSF